MLSLEPKIKQALYKHKINGPEPIINTETSSPGTLLCPLKATAFVLSCWDSSCVFLVQVAIIYTNHRRPDNGLFIWPLVNYKLE